MLEFLTVLPASQQPTAEGIFNRFAEKTMIPVQGVYVGWDSIWRELVQIGIYKRGPDLGETGSTWLESLAEMNVLRPFQRDEIERMGGQAAFIESAWQGVIFGKEKKVWGIPSHIDPRVIYYWKDMLDSAGPGAHSAFSSLKKLPDTFEKLKKFSPSPWAVITSNNDPATIQTMASWIWQAGSDFISADGKQVRFNEPAFLDAAVNYFDLHQYAPQQGNISGASLNQLFTQRKIAACIGGPWTYMNLLEQNTPKEILTQVGVAPIPAPSFLGGMTLIVFQHTFQERSALEFVEYLTQPQVQLDYTPMVGLLPTRHAAWDLPPLCDHPVYLMMYQAAQGGRTFPAVPLWGTVEDRLVKTTSAIWNELMTNEKADTRSVVEKYMTPLAARLNAVLSK